MQTSTSTIKNRATVHQHQAKRAPPETPNFALEPSPRPSAATVEAASRFEPLLKEYLALRRDWVRLGKDARERAEKKFAGLAWHGMAGEDPKWQYFESIGKQNGYRALCDRLSELFDTMEPLAESIRNSTARSTEELRALAMVAIWDTLPWQANSSDLSFDRADTYGALLDSVVAITGLSELAGLAAASMPSHS